jgi:tetratricopeptide (TPR) repeat protein
MSVYGPLAQFEHKIARSSKFAKYVPKESVLRCARCLFGKRIHESALSYAGERWCVMRCRTLLLLVAVVWSFGHETHAQTPALALRYYEAGEKKMGHADWVGTVEDLTKAIELNAHLDPAKWQNKKRTRDQAVDNPQSDSNEVAVSDSFTAYAYTNRAVARFYLGDFDAAITDFERALRIKPKLAEAYSGRASARNAKGDLEGALLDFGRALKLNEKFVEVYNNRGLVLLEKNDFAGAIKDFNRAIELKPTLASAHLGRGTSFMKQGSLDLAVRDFTRTVELDPDNAEAYGNRGLAQMVLGREREASIDLQKCIELKSELKTSLEARTELAKKLTRIYTARSR